MRRFSFKARNIGQEKYLTYTMGEDCELDEDVLDYCEENKLEELIGIIYEEDDDYDYLTYDVTEKVSLEDYIKNTMNCEKVLSILRNLAGGLIALKEHAIQLSYILLNRSFIYVDEKTYGLKFICLPIESDASVAAEFKGFVRQLLANMKYNIEEDLSYVGKLLTYINGDGFNLRGLIGLCEALMEEAGIVFEEAGAIDADGVEVVNAQPEMKDAQTEEENVADFMNSLSGQDEPLPEIGDDEEDEPVETEDKDTESETEEELESILPAGMKFSEPVSEDAEATDTETADVEVADAETESEVELKKDESEPAQAEKVEENKADTIPAKSEFKLAGDDDFVKKSSEKEPTILPGAENVLKMAEETEADDVKAEPEAVKTEEAEAKTETDATAQVPKNNSFKLENAVMNEDATAQGGAKRSKKETDINLIKNRIKELVGEVPSAKSTDSGNKSIKTLAELDEFLDSRPPVVKKNVVKVNRAALIQNIAAEQEAEQETEQEEVVEEVVVETQDNSSDDLTENIKVPVIEESYEEENEDTDNEEVAEEKPKGNSILSRIVGEAPKLVNLGGALGGTLGGTPKAIPYLIRVNTEERIMLSKVTFKIGKASRGVDYTVSGNGAISRQHAIILQREGVCYIKDNKSTNHTYVNGKMVEDGVEEILTHDSMIRLGDEEFLFKIR